MADQKTKNGVESMPEALVSLQLAFWLLDHGQPNSHVDIAIDGAHVRIKAHEHRGQWIEERTVFPIEEFLQANQCQQITPEEWWQGTYQRKTCTFKIESVRGFDVRGKLDGMTIRAECKGGPLGRKPGKSETAIFASAIGQVVAAASGNSDDEFWVAVPESPSFEAVGRRIVETPMFKATTIRIALVNKTGQVRFLNRLPPRSVPPPKRNSCP